MENPFLAENWDESRLFHATYLSSTFPFLIVWISPDVQYKWPMSVSIKYLKCQKKRLTINECSFYNSAEEVTVR